MLLVYLVNTVPEKRQLKYDGTRICVIACTSVQINSHDL